MQEAIVVSYQLNWNQIMTVSKILKGISSDCSHYDILCIREVFVIKNGGFKYETSHETAYFVYLYILTVR